MIKSFLLYCLNNLYRKKYENRLNVFYELETLWNWELYDNCVKDEIEALKNFMQLCNLFSFFNNQQDTILIVSINNIISVLLLKILRRSCKSDE